MLIRRTLHECILIVWASWLKAQQAWHESYALPGSKQNDLPDGDNTLYTKHIILWQGHLADYTTLDIWWVFETESEVNCGIMTKSRQDNRQQYTFEGRIQWKNTEKLDNKATSWLKVIVHLGIGLCCATIWECAVGDKNKRSTNGHIVYAMIHPCLYLIQIVTKWGIFRRQMVCANAGYL